MTQKKSPIQQIISHAVLLLLAFSCAGKKDFSSRNSVESSQYRHYPQAYQPYYPPYSRAYGNPYATPPQNYHPYYDFDQYYVPPNKYKNVEQNSSGIDGKF